MRSTRDLYTRDDAAGTAFLLGLDPTDPKALRIAGRANRCRSIDFLRKGTTRRDTTTGARAYTTTTGDTGLDIPAQADARAIDPAAAAEGKDIVARILRALTPKESQALRVLLRGGRAADIAQALGCAQATASVHVHNLRRKAAALLALA